jgi:hypothetical protein
MTATRITNTSTRHMHTYHRRHSRKRDRAYLKLGKRQSCCVAICDCHTPAQTQHTRRRKATHVPPTSVTQCIVTSHCVAAHRSHSTLPQHATTASSPSGVSPTSSIVSTHCERRRDHTRHVTHNQYLQCVRFGREQMQRNRRVGTPRIVLSYKSVQVSHTKSRHLVITRQ